MNASASPASHLSAVPCIVVVQPSIPPGPSLTRLVRSAGYHVDVVRDPARVRGLVRRRRVDGIVVYVSSTEPIVMLSALRPSTPPWGPGSFPVIAVAAPATIDASQALLAGADDALVAPVDPEELLARLTASLRRTRPSEEEPTVVATPHFTLDLTNRLSWQPGGTIHLTGIEWQLVDALVRHPGRLVPAERLLECVWGTAGADRRAHLRVHAYGLRRKLEPDPRHPRYFITEAGIGMRFVPAEPA